MKKLFLLLVLVFLLSCNEYATYESLNYCSDTETPQTRYAGDRVWDVLGFGYDVTGVYLGPKSVKAPVIDITRMYKENPGRLIWSGTTVGKQDFFYGYNATDYLNEITKEVNVEFKAQYKLFGATLSMSRFAKNSYTYSSKYSFASCDVIKEVKWIYINSTFDYLLNYLDPVFIEDINSLSANEIIERYGTHVLTDFTIGGRLNLIFRSIIDSSSDIEEKKMKVKAGANASLMGIGVQTDVTVSQNTIDSYADDNRNKELHVEYYGGEGAGISYNMETGNPTINVHLWESSVNDGNAALTTINWKKAYPIYDFVTDTKKKELIRNAFYTYIRSRELNMIGMVKIKNSDSYLLKDSIPGSTPLYIYRGTRFVTFYYGYSLENRSVFAGSSIFKNRGVAGYCFTEAQPGMIRVMINERPTNYIGNYPFSPLYIYVPE